MEIKESTVKKLELSGIDGIDPIYVFAEDHAQRQGTLTIKCWDQVWSAYWGGIGQESIMHFICGCDEHYILKKLSGIQEEVKDYDNLQDWLRAEVIRQRREWPVGDMDKSRAKHLWRKIDFGESCEEFTHTESFEKVMSLLFGEEWFRWVDFPTKKNSDYVYLCKIITAVKDAFKRILNSRECAA